MSRTYLRLKACPRCRGDILVDKVFEDDDVCLQCGFRGQRSDADRLFLHDAGEVVSIKRREQPNRKVAAKVK